MATSKHNKIKEHFKKADPKMFKVMETLNFDDWLGNHPFPKNRRDYFVALCRDIVGQQLSGKAADSIYKRFEALFGKKAITAQNILKIKDDDLRNVGMSWAKVRYIKDLAQKVATKQLVLDNIHEMLDEEIIKELTKVKGIGNWTVEMFLIFTLKRENVFSFGDLGLKKGFEKVYNKSQVTKEQIERVIKKWHPYKSFGAIALWYSLEKD